MFDSLSMLDLVSDGSSWDEIVTLAQSIEDVGASIINTGWFIIYFFFL